MSKLKGDPGYRDGWCIHYRASPGLDPMPETCEAGVVYSTLPKAFAERPCFLTKGKSRPDSAPCDKLRLPTPEEIAAHDAWAKARHEKLFKAFAHIAPWREANKGRGASQIIDCPICSGKGTFAMSITGRNGHVHARCSTDGCVSWIE